MEWIKGAWKKCISTTNLSSNKGKKPLTEIEIKKKALEGAKKAIREYDETFKILTEYDKQH